MELTVPLRDGNVSIAPRGGRISAAGAQRKGVCNGGFR